MWKDDIAKFVFTSTDRYVSNT